jgi:O-antigen ligase
MASAVVVSLPFTILTNSFFIILLTLNWLAEGEWAAKWRLAKTSPVILACVSMYTLYIVGLLYSSNLSQGFFVLEKKIAILILPLVFFTQKNTGPLNKRILLLLFIASCTLFIGYYGFQLLVFDIDKLHELRAQEISTRIVLFSLYGIHPTYASTYFIFSAIAILFLVYSTDYKLNSKTRYFLLLLVPVFAFAMLVLAARGPILIALAIAGAFYIKKVYTYRYFTILVLAGLLLTAALGTIVWNTSKTTRDRFMEFNHPASYEIPRTGGPFNSMNTRVAIIHATTDLMQRYWLVGTGTGDLQDKLDAYYIENDFHAMLSDNHYNTHNQYLEIWLTLGIAGILSFVYFILIFIKRAVLYKDLLVLSLILFFSVNSMSDTLLETQKGIVFYILFLCALTSPLRK